MKNPDFNERIFSSAAADFAIAQAQMCFFRYGDDDPALLSQRISEAVGRPVLAVSLDRLPYRLSPNQSDRDQRMLSVPQAADHAKILQGFAAKAFANNPWFVKKWDWVQSGQLHTVNNFVLRVDEEQKEALPSRLAGNFWAKGAVMTTADRRWGERELWSRISGVAPEELEYFPKGNGVRAYNLGHEIAHILQRGPTARVVEDAWEWTTEGDADDGSLAGLAQVATDEEFAGHVEMLEDTARGVGHGRPLSAFCAAMPAYWLALPLNGYDVDQDKAVKCNYELRLRTYAEMEKIMLPQSSAQLQESISKWVHHKDDGSKLHEIMSDLFTEPIGWGRYNDLGRAIPALNRVLRRGAFTDLMASVNAELVIEAATYFKPSLWPKLHWPPVEARPVRRRQTFTLPQQQAVPQPLEQQRAAQALTPVQMACKPGG